MNKYSVELHSYSNGTDVWIEFGVKTDMTIKQLQTYYEYVGGLSVSKVVIGELK
jgi:hypothetical protein